MVQNASLSRWRPRVRVSSAPFFFIFMKVGIIGAGAVGNVILNHIYGSSIIKEVHILDFDKKALKRIEKRRNIVFHNKDATDIESLKNFVENINLVVNAATPSINMQVMEICYDNKVDYIDLANDEIDQQLKLQDKWKKRGISAILGMGVDPGLSNIFAKYISNKLDVVKEIRIRDGDTSYTKEYILAVLYSPSVFLDEVLYYPAIVYRRGKFYLEPPLSGEEVYKFPNPVGRLSVYGVSHEEVETLPHYLNKEVEYVDFKLSFSKEVIQILFALDRMGLTKKTEIKMGGRKIIPRDVLIRLMPRPDFLVGKVKGHAVVVTEIRGIIGKDKITHKLFTLMSHEEAFSKYNTTATAFQTGTPPAALILLMAQRKIKKKGVYPAEELPAELLLRKIKQMGLPMEEEIVVRKELMSKIYS